MYLPESNGYNIIILIIGTYRWKHTAAMHETSRETSLIELGWERPLRRRKCHAVIKFYKIQRLVSTIHAVDKIYDPLHYPPPPPYVQLI